MRNKEGFKNDERRTVKGVGVFADLPTFKGPNPPVDGFFGDADTLQAGGEWFTDTAGPDAPQSNANDCDERHPGSMKNQTT